MSKDKKDHGQHYRFSYNGINLDPFRICQIYNVSDFALQTIVKKALCAGGRGHKDFRQDLLDIICAAERRLEMLDEDNIQFTLPNAEPEQSPQSPDKLPWIKNTGVAPDCKKVLAKRKDDEYCNENNVESLSWGLLNDNYDIVEYLILE